MKDFTYNEQEHKGYYKGKLIPSITALVSLVFPLGEINAEVLEKASNRGTLVHNDIDETLTGFKVDAETQEGQNFIRLVKSLGFRPVESETTLYFRNHSGDIISYGHSDQIFISTKYVYLKEGVLLVDDNPTLEGSETILYGKGDYILTDTKTVSQFNDKKVELQLNLYSIGEKDNGKQLDISGIAGIWVRDEKVQLRPLDLKDKESTIEMLETLVSEWESRQ